MPPRSHLAIEVALWLIDDDPDDTRRAAPLRMLQHINGTLGDEETRARYGACDAIVGATEVSIKKKESA